MFRIVGVAFPYKRCVLVIHIILLEVAKNLETIPLNTNETSEMPTAGELKQMPKGQLEKYLKKIQKAVESYPHRKSAEAYPEIKKTLDTHGISFEEFSSYMDKERKVTPAAKKVAKVRKAKKSKAPATPKYQSPEDPAVTWTGKGRRPAWFLQHVDAGGDPESLKIS